MMKKKDIEKPSVADATRAVEEAFFTQLSQIELAGKGSSAALVSEVRSRLAERQAHVALLINNEMDEMNVRFTLLAVAAYDVLEPRLGQPRAMHRIDECLNRPLKAQILHGTRAFLDNAEQPFVALINASKQREEHYFGPSFTFERRIDDDYGYVLEIRRCLYHEVLKACGRTELQPLLCRFDLSWIEAIDPKRHAMRFIRPSTFATADTCRMWFARSEGDDRASLPVIDGA